MDRILEHGKAGLAFADCDRARACASRHDNLGSAGPLTLRLAQDMSDVIAAQRLRHQIFFAAREGAFVQNGLALDQDHYDAFCDHLLVEDQETGRLVGTYRLLRQDHAALAGSFYSESEFDIAPLLNRHRGLRFLELGRSCVLEAYRDKRSVELLWHGIWTYVRQHRIQALFGCASLPGTDPAQLALPLAFLHHHARADTAWLATARPERYVSMNLMPREHVDPRLAMRGLPPLIKGYLRLGARFGDGAVIDRDFGTTDVLVVLPVEAINARYIGYFGQDATRYAA
jgi:L-ornithine Nalpha-acyltransferase